MVWTFTSRASSAVYEAMVMIALEGSDTPTGLEDYTPQAATPAIIDMVRKMNKYILPPKFDFLRFFAEREPLAMYIFDFEHEFNRGDLTNMWQNVSPPSGKDFKIMTSTASHMIDPAELGGDFTDKLGQLRWLVFKVKQKAEKFYLNKTLSAFDDPKVVKAFSAQNKADLERRVPYSYNWPYDYFSLIELIKIDADINIEAPRRKGKGKTLNIKTSDSGKSAQASDTSSKKMGLLE